MLAPCKNFSKLAVMLDF